MFYYTHFILFMSYSPFYIQISEQHSKEAKLRNVQMI